MEDLLQYAEMVSEWFIQVKRFEIKVMDKDLNFVGVKTMISQQGIHTR